MHKGEVAWFFPPNLSAQKPLSAAEATGRGETEQRIESKSTPAAKRVGTTTKGTSPPKGRESLPAAAFVTMPQKLTREEAHEALGLEPEGEKTDDEVRKAYKKMSLATHPDKNPVSAWRSSVGHPCSPGVVFIFHLCCCLDSRRRICSMCCYIDHYIFALLWMAIAYGCALA